MTRARLFLLIVFCFSGFSFSSVSLAADGESIFNKFVEAAGEALGDKVEDELDKLSGNYAGKITNITLVKRLGNKLVFDVNFEGIKRTDGVSIVKEVMFQGEVLSSFVSSPSPVNRRDGKLRLSIKFNSSGEDDGWGIESDSSDESYSDQIRLSLVRDSKPEKTFGALAFDIDKIWIDSDEEDVPFEEDEEISLADEGDSTQPRPKPGVFIVPGSVMKPVPLKTAPLKASPSKASSAKIDASKANTAQASTAQVGTSQGQAVKAPQSSSTSGGVRTQRLPTKIKPMPITVNGRYDIYANANKVKWATGKGNKIQMAVGARTRGAVKQIEKGKLSTGNSASKMIFTRPISNHDGYITGTLPQVKLGKSIHFKSAIGFVGNASKSDGVIFSVYMVDTTTNKRTSRMIRKRVDPKKYEYIDLDLSRYAGKVVTLMMRVDAGSTATQDTAVWIAPRFETVK